MIDLNRANLSLEPVNTAINAALERVAATTAELPRPYLGASIIGHECARRIQFDWWIKPALAARTRETGNQSDPDRVLRDQKNDWDSRSCLLRREHRNGSSPCHNDCDPATN